MTDHRAATDDRVPAGPGRLVGSSTSDRGIRPPGAARGLCLDPVGLGPAGGLAHRLAVGQHDRRTCGSTIRAIARAFARLNGDRVGRREARANSRLGRRRHSSRGTHRASWAIAITKKSRWTSIQILLTPTSSSSLNVEKRRATGQLRIRALGTPGRSRGRPTTNCGLSAHRRPGLPNQRSRRAPRPTTADGDARRSATSPRTASRTITQEGDDLEEAVAA